MPIHYHIDKFNLLEEVRRLEEAGMIVRFILPEETLDLGHSVAIVTKYIIIFDEP